MQKPIVCIFCEKSHFRIRLESHLGNHYSLLFSETILDLMDLLKKNEIACLIVHPIQYGVCGLWQFREIKKNFELIPLIIICRYDHYDFVKACAIAFADDHLYFDEIKLIPGRVQSAIDQCNFHKQILTTNEITLSYPTRVKKALKIIHGGFTKIKFTEEVSCQLGISVTTFRKEFKQFYDTSFTQYLIQIKLLYAAYLAQNDGLRGKTIAHRCGFDDEHEFYRSFKKKIGLSFSEYRSKYTFQEFNQLYNSNSK